MKPAFQLPFKCGQTWRASTYGPTADKPDQHHYPDADSLDLLRFDGNTNISANEDVLASAAGTVIEAHDTNSEDPPYGSTVSIQHEGNWRTQYIHLDDALSVKKDDKVVRGQKIGVVSGKIQIEDWAPHLHYTQWNGNELTNKCDVCGLKFPSGVRATFNGVDTIVHEGAVKADGSFPTEDLVSANCPVPPFGPPVSAVSRKSSCLDVFAIGRDGRILGAAWEQQVLDGQWRGWWHIQGGKTSKNAVIASVSRHPNKLDVFVVGGNGTVYTAASDNKINESEWRGWWSILDLKAPPGSAVSAVSRDPNKLDVFVVGNNGRIYTAAWDQNVSQGKWRGWWNIQDGKDCPPGAPVSAVSRDPNKLDVFVVGNNGIVYTAAWDQNVSQGKWRGWWKIEP